jgi:hypothetical protein
MSAVTKIREYIEQVPIDQAFSSNELRIYGSTDNVRQILARLVKAGEIYRVGRGLFAKPKMNRLVGVVLPYHREVIKTLCKITGETVGIQGAEAALRLQLSTQVPVKPVYYTSGKTRTIKLGGMTVILRHTSARHLRLAGTFAGLAISALTYCGKRDITLKTLQKIYDLVGPERFQEIQQAVSYMPGWLADLFYRYQQKQM